jgi:PKD repeat protein
MADARIRFAAATGIVTALAALLLIAERPVLALAQPQSNQDSQQEQMPASGSMQTPGAIPGPSFNHVDLPQPPVITMTAVPGYGAAPLTVGFFVNTVDPEGKGFVSYLWNFGDGQVSMDPPLTFFHTYQTVGSYVATVNATTADGRTAVAYVGVTVRPGIVN